MIPWGMWLAYASEEERKEFADAMNQVGKGWGTLLWPCAALLAVAGFHWLF